MPFYKVYADYPISESACDRILNNGLPAEVFPIAVRVHTVSRSPEQTRFDIECDDEDVANNWLDALKDALGEVIPFVYSPPTPSPAPTALDVWARVGTWTKAVAGATTTVSGLPAAPKAVILWGSGKSGSTVGTFDEYGGFCLGFSNGTTHRLNAICAQDNVATSNTGRTINSRPYTLMDETQAGTNIITEVANSISFGATSFDINWSATTLATSGAYFVIGGNDITAVEIKDYHYDTTTPKIVEYTGLGAKFDFALLTSSSFTGVGYTQVDANSVVSSISCQGGQDISANWSASHTWRDNQSPTSQFRIQRRNRMLISMASDSAVLETAALWGGWTDDGFKLDWYAPPGATDVLMTGLFIKGGKWDAGSFDQPTSNGTVTTLLYDVLGELQGIMGFSISNAAMKNNNGAANSRAVIGAQDSTGNKACLSTGGESGANPSVEATVMVTDRFMKHITPAATAASSTTNAQCTVSDMATDGEFTVDYTTTDSTPRQVLWFTLSA